jgi:hypothetical protein
MLCCTYVGDIEYKWISEHVDILIFGKTKDVETTLRKTLPLSNLILHPPWYLIH